VRDESGAFLSGATVHMTDARGADRTAITDANALLSQVNPRMPTVRRDWQLFGGTVQAYSDAAHNILSILDSFATTSATITTHANALDELLLAGWVHYLAFDLFIGSWEVEDAAANGIPHWLLLPCLFLTLMVGPVGLLRGGSLGSRLGYLGTHRRHSFTTA